MTDPHRPGFTNAPVSTEGLPRLAGETFEPLDPRYVQIRWLSDAIVAVMVMVAAGAVTAAWQADGYRWVPTAVAGGLLVLLGLLAWLQRVEVDHLGYLVREHDLSFRQGVIGRRVTTVPFARIQNVRIDRGPVARAFGLATLQLRTAGDGLVVPGIDVETAERLKALVADRAGALADEEFSSGSPPATSAPPPVPSADPRVALGAPPPPPVPSADPPVALGAPPPPPVEPPGPYPVAPPGRLPEPPAP